ncbi:unnamed protein product, partial [Dovyalis caffra]
MDVDWDFLPIYDIYYDDTKVINIDNDDNKVVINDDLIERIKVECKEIMRDPLSVAGKSYRLGIWLSGTTIYGTIFRIDLGEDEDYF